MVPAFDHLVRQRRRLAERLPSTMSRSDQRTEIAATSLPPPASTDITAANASAVSAIVEDASR